MVGVLIPPLSSRSVKLWHAVKSLLRHTLIIWRSVTACRAECQLLSEQSRYQTDDVSFYTNRRRSGVTGTKDIQHPETEGTPDAAQPPARTMSRMCPETFLTDDTDPPPTENLTHFLFSCVTNRLFSSGTVGRLQKFVASHMVGVTSPPPTHTHSGEPQQMSRKCQDTNTPDVQMRLLVIGGSPPAAERSRALQHVFSGSGPAHWRLINKRWYITANQNKCTLY